jgi:dolichol kinase
VEGRVTAAASPDPRAPDPHAPEPLFRPLLHAAMGLFALALGVLPRPLAVLAAAAAVLFNWAVLPRLRVERRLRRPGEPFVAGLRTYPLAVFGLVLTLPAAEAAAAWAVLSFGDPAAAIAGTRWRSPAVFGHRKATWTGSGAYLVVGALAAHGMGRAVAAIGAATHTPTGDAPSLLGAAVAAVAAVLVDLVPVPPDDNVPAAVAAGLAVRACRGVI